MVVRGKSLGEKMSQYLVDRLESLPNVRDPAARPTSRACHGDEHLEAITVADRATNATEQVRTRYLFVFIGADPNTAWLNDSRRARRARLHPDRPRHQARRTLKDWPLDARAVSARSERPRHLRGG